MAFGFLSGTVAVVEASGEFERIPARLDEFLEMFYLANTLTNSQGVFEVSDMEQWKCQLDKPEMPDAVLLT